MLSILFLLLGFAQASSQPKLQDPEVALNRALQYLVKSQNPDGSWGSVANPGPYDEFWWNIETHRAWQRATSSLCVLALLEQGSRPEQQAASEKGLRFLLQQRPIKRPSDWDVDNTWAYVYSLQTFARAHRSERFANQPIREECKIAAEKELQALAKYQTPDGGWGYYDFETLARRPSWSTSFMTAAAVLAILETKESGIPVDEKMLARAVKAVSRCRLPSGAYTYSVQATPSPGGMEWIDQIKGSLGRIQIGNLALFRADSGVTLAELQRGLEYFFQHHKFLYIAKGKPVPHEAYYLNSGYFYFFGHHYAAMAITLLPAKDQARYWPKLQHEIIKDQNADGSMWDYYMNSYHKPYGTAFAVMALGRSLAK